MAHTHEYTNALVMTEEIAHAQLIQYIKDKISLTPSEEELVRTRFHLQKMKRKEFFLQEGQECLSQGFIIEGTFRVFFIDNKGSEHVLYFGFKDWWVGDIASFHSHEPSKMNIQAMEDSYILSFSQVDLEYLFGHVPAFERMFRIMTQRTLAVLQKRFLLTISANAEERYKELIQRHPGIEQLVPQHQIASYLGILPESLSRMKKLLYKK
jgi:CRP-like cAMP-binding protein